MNYSRENDELRQRIVELEHQSPHCLVQICSYHGPDTIEPQKFLFGRNQC